MPDAIHGGAVNLACEDDRLWFDWNSDRDYRFREVVLGEFAELGPLPHGMVWRVLYYPMTVTIQRLSAPEPSSFTDWTNPVTVDPVSVNVAFWPRYWAYRARLASIGSVVSIVCTSLPQVAVRGTAPRPAHKVSLKH